MEEFTLPIRGRIHKYRDIKEDMKKALSKYYLGL